MLDVVSAKLIAARGRAHVGLKRAAGGEFFDESRKQPRENLFSASQDGMRMLPARILIMRRWPVRRRFPLHNAHVLEKVRENARAQQPGDTIAYNDRVLRDSLNH